MPAPFVSFVIVNWNGRHHLEQVLPSIQQQTFKDFEVFVVDNGSNDNSVSFVNENFPNVNVIQLKTNEGFAEPNNIAFRAAKGKWIATVNNDMVLDERWLENLLKGIEVFPNCFSAQGTILRSDDRITVDSCGLGIRACGAARNLFHNRKVADISASVRPIFSASAGAAIFNRELLMSLGAFDQTYFAYYEDLDTGWRARINGYESFWVPHAVAYHKVHGTSTKLTSHSLWFLSERNRLRTVAKNLPLKSFSGKFILDELRYVDMIRHKAGWGTLFKARWTFMKEFRSLIKQRPAQLKNISKEEWQKWLQLSLE
ncbi:MAG TPA: glycosyltransferase family 2 protein [Acidobacteriota bacterium]|nr:glycosyltransferase family 2 protein [Acidobacteriota bacterium]